MHYVDSSVFVALLTSEARQKDVQDWVRNQPDNSLCVSAWVGTEIASALAIKVRMGKLTRGERASALSLYRNLVANNLVAEQITGAHFEMVDRFIDDVSLGLRGGDALHLAIASSGAHTLATLDKQLAAAGPPLGIATLLL